MSKKHLYLFIFVLLIFAGCVESDISESRAIEISRETEEVKTLLEGDPSAYSEAEESEFQGKNCWAVSWFSEGSLHYPDAPVHTIYVDKQDGEVLDIFTTKRFVRS